MEIRHVRYFLAIADSGSFTRAASELGIAQPALSQALNRMEKELGVRLFDRSRRGATLTPAGLAMVDDLRLSVARLDAAAHRAGEIGAQRAGRLTIGFVSAALFDTLPRAIRALRESAPDVELVMREMSNAEQAIALERGEIDIGLLHTPVAVNGRMPRATDPARSTRRGAAEGVPAPARRHGDAGPIWPRPASCGFRTINCR
ncbi:LysR family transcriptional regulator [Burkholderia cenocepacia]|nr:LysR family transcriptional regulator [Burkholderia cenocepacia]